MKRVLTVGCSFTLGDELKNPQHDSWPALLAQCNDWEVTNLGLSGGSNDRNIRVVMEEIKNEYDLIIVAWTMPERFEVAESNNNSEVRDISTTKIGPHVNLRWVPDFYAMHGDRFFFFHKWISQIILLQSYLKQSNQKYIFCSTFGIFSNLKQGYYNEYMPKLDHLIKQVDAAYYVEWPQWGITDWVGDAPVGKQGKHPLGLGHERIAEKINEHIRNLGWLS